jgi:hypothetical protein
MLRQWEARAAPCSSRSSRLVDRRHAVHFRTLVFSVCSFLLGVTLFPSGTHVKSSVSGALPTRSDNRESDRQAIRDHLEKIFRAYVNKDLATIRATHAHNWTGFTLGARSIIHDLDEYMRDAERATKNPLLITDYKLSDIDFVFYGDVALVPYVADVVAGSDLPGKFRSLDVYAKIDNQWIQVGSNINLHPETQEDQRQQPASLSAAQRQDLLAAREAIWRACFRNDRALLEKTFPAETIAINADSEQWSDRAGVLASTAQFVEAGGKLRRLGFPRTEIQLYGDVAILYSNYLYETETRGKTSIQSGRATEVFVRRKGTWVNSGWHLDSGK